MAKVKGDNPDRKLGRWSLTAKLRQSSRGRKPPTENPNPTSSRLGLRLNT
jgi:hypothetical protein